MQLQMIEPCLNKYCSFDYNAFLIKKRIKAGTKHLPRPHIMVEKHSSLYNGFRNLHPIPDDFKSSPYKMQIETQGLDRPTFAKLSFDHYCKCFGFKKGSMYSDLKVKT